MPPNSLRSTDAEPVVRAHLADMLAMIGKEAPQIEDDDRLDDLGLDELSTAWLITELYVATGVDPFASGIAAADVRTVGDLITAYWDTLAKAERGEPPAAHADTDADAASARGTRHQPWHIGPLVELAADRYAATLQFDEHAESDAAPAAEQRLPEDVLVQAARQLWIEAVQREQPSLARRARLWIDRIEAVFSEPVLRRRTMLECVFRSRVREPLCERVAVTAYARQDNRLAVVITAEARLVPAAVARTYDALKARSSAPRSAPVPE